MKEVSKEEYYNSFKNLDAAVLSIEDSNGYPYIFTWSLIFNRKIIAKKVPIENTNNYKYFIKTN